jgi:hypothetical protein
VGKMCGEGYVCDEKWINSWKLANFKNRGLTCPVEKLSRNGAQTLLFFDW